jgi:acyl-CoA synthetase (AMP-forming)/AMP-acid ligase II
MNFLETPLKTSTLVDLLRYRALHQPDKQAYRFLVDGETVSVDLTYQELEQQAQAIASQLQQFCQPGDRALLLYQPGIEYISAFFGCLFAGVVAVPAYPPRPNRSLSRIQSILTDAQAAVALTTTSIFSSLAQRVADAPELKTLGWLATDQIDPIQANSWQDPQVNSRHLAFLQYTSGSTATPKGVMISHHNLLQNLEAIAHCFGHSPQSRGVIWLPPYHDMGLIGGILQPLYAGFPVVLMSPLVFLQSPFRWLQAVSRYQATTSGGPNFAYELCIQKITPEQKLSLDLSSWEVAFNGAEPINAATLEQFAATFAECGFRREAFYPCYGMAETTLIVSGGAKTALPIYQKVEAAALEKNWVVPISPESNKELTTRTLVGCGRQIPRHQIAIAHPETLTRCTAGEVGEIWIKGPSVAQGYWNKTEESRHAFGAYLADTGEGPFLRTGDLGFLDNDELYVTGRLKDLIIVNGHNHYPQDIERTVEHSHPAIRPTCAAAFSVEIDGEERLIIVAEVERRYRQRKRQAALSSEDPSQHYSWEVKAVIQSIRRSVSSHHDLQVYQAFLIKHGTIPKTSSGKIQRHACRANFLAGTLDIVEE